jgi:hypothetical protein
MQTKYEAIEQVTANHPADYAALSAFALAWVRSRHKEFTIELLRDDFEAAGYVLRQPNLYGAVMTNLEKAGEIFYVRHQKSKSEKARGRQVSVWISKAFRIKQQRNARRTHPQPGLFA